MTTPHDGLSEATEPKYLTKKVVLNGQTVTLYSINGVTWLSSPDQIPDVMARLDNTRILLADPKAAAEQGITAQPAAPKSTGARYRMKGPKPRPILQPDGTLLPPTERLATPAVDTDISVSSESVEVLDDSPAARIRQLRAPKEEAKKAEAKSKKQAVQKAAVKPVPVKSPKVAAVKASNSKVKAAKTGKSSAGEKSSNSKKSMRTAKAVKAKLVKSSAKPLAKVATKKVVKKTGKGEKKR